MKKQVKTLIIVSAAILVLIALLLSLMFLIPDDDDTESSSSPADDTISLIDKTKADGKTVDMPVKGVKIKAGQEEFEIALGQDKQLVVKGYEDLPIGTSEIESLTNKLSSLSATRKVADNSDNEADFGLDKPRATAKATYHDDSVVNFELGDNSVGDTGCYLRIESGGPIYLVDVSFGEQLLKQSVMYIGTTLITAPDVKKDSEGDTAVLKNMKLSGRVRAKKPFEFGVNQSDDKSAGFSLYITKKPIVKGTSETASTIAQAVTSLYAVQAVKAHPKAADLDKYGLKNPHSICEMTLAVMTTSSSEDKSEPDTVYYNSTDYTIKLGNKNDDGDYYATVDGIDAVYLVSPSAVPWAETQFGDIVTNMMFIRDITGVKSITLERNGKSTTFELTHYPDEEDRDKSLVVKAGGKTYSTPEFRDLYQVFMMVYRHGELDSKPTGKADIVFDLKPIKKSDGEFTARFYKQSASVYACVLSDGDYFSVKASDVQRMLEQTENYLNGKDVKTY